MSTAAIRDLHWLLRRYLPRHWLISRPCVFIGICRDTKVSGQFPLSGVSQFFRCEAPFSHHPEIERRITPPPLAQKSSAPPPLLASSPVAPTPHCSRLYGPVTWMQPGWLVASLETPGNVGPSRKHS